MATTIQGLIGAASSIGGLVSAGADRADDSDPRLPARLFYPCGNAPNRRHCLVCPTASAYAAAGDPSGEIQVMKQQNLQFDVVVCCSGLAGVCAAIAAARGSATTCLVQDRPVLGATVPLKFA